MMARPGPRSIALRRRRSRLALDWLEPRIAPAGNILVSTDATTFGTAPVIREFTPSGTEVRELSLSPNTTDYGRGLATSPDGKIYDYFDTFTPQVLVYDPATLLWTGHTFAGWSTQNVLTSGGLAYGNGFVYATDQLTSGDGSTQGVVRFSATDYSAQRFDTNIGPTELSLGLDGNLYALSANSVTVIDPTTMAEVRTVTLPFTLGSTFEDYRGVTADASGNIYASTWGGDLFRFDSNGNVQTDLHVGGNFYNLAVDTDGALIAGAANGTVVESTTALSGVTRSFNVGGTGHVFVAFAGGATTIPAPPPSITISDATTFEGNNGSHPMAFVVQLSHAYTGTVTVNYATADGTATLADNDYQSTSGTLTFTAGQVSQTVSVMVNGDTKVEPDETMSLVLSSPTNATIGRGTGVGTILNDDSAPVSQSLSASSSGVLSDDTGTGQFTVQASGSTTLGVARFTTNPGPGVPYDERSVLEFTAPSSNNGILMGASLQLTGLTVGSQTGEVDVYGFEDSDGVTLADATRRAAFLGSFTPTSAQTYTIPLSTTALQTVLAGGLTNLGIRISGVPGDAVTFAGTAAANAPALVLQYTPPTVNVNDVTVSEGNVASFSLALSQPLTTPVTVNYTTGPAASGPQATPNADYVPVSGTLTFNPGQQSQTINVPTLADVNGIGTASFNLVLSNPSSPVILGDASGRAIIIDALHPTPSITVNNVSVPEGNTGTTAAVFTVSLTAPSTNTVTVNYATADGTATVAGNDYVAASGTLSFAPGQTSQTVPVTINGDTLSEGNETFTLNLSNPTNAAVLVPSGTGTIVDDDPVPVATINDASVTKGTSGSTTITFTISLSAPSANPISLQVLTANGTALARDNYQPLNTTVTFTPGQTTRTVSTLVFGDTNTEGNETFTVNLSQPQGDVTIGRGTAIGTIIDDNPTTGTMSLGASAWAYADDSNGDGVLDTLNTSSLVLPIQDETSPTIVQDRALLVYDVSPIVAGLVSSVTFSFGVESYLATDALVSIGGFASNGGLTLADATRSVTPLGSYQPSGGGTRTVTLDRAAVLAIVGQSSYLGLRLEGAATPVSTSIDDPARGSASPLPTLTFHVDLPVAFNDAYSVNEGSSLTVAAATGVLANDYSLPSTTLTATVSQLPAHGTLALASDGSFVYTPSPLYRGSDSFTYTASDGTHTTSAATVTLTVNPVNHPPQATGDSYSVAEGSTLTVATPGVLANDTDVDGDPLTAAVVTSPAHGTLALASNGSFVYTPSPLYRGSDSFTYVANDGQANSNVATVALTVTPVNHAPVAANDSYSVLEGTTLTIAAPGVLVNDTDVDGDPLTALQKSSPAHGTLAIGSDGSFVYTPTPTYSGADSFTYVASDGSLSSAVTTVTLNVVHIDHPPTATAQSIVDVQNSSTPVVLSGTDPDGDTLTYSVATGPAHGSLSGTAPNLMYTPGPGYFGPDSFTFQASDGTLSSPSATVSILVDARPTASPVNVETLENAATAVALSASDPDNSVLTYSVVAGPAHGSLSGTAPNLTYTPASGYFGADSFTYKANDGTTDSNVATVSIVVNAPPVASPVSVTTVENASAAVPLSASDPDGDTLTYRVVASPLHGTLSGTAPNLTYTPASGYFGADSFTFSANDGTADSNVATVRIVVDAPPTAGAVSLTTVENVPAGLTLAGSDPDRNALTYTVISGPSHGSLSGTAPNLTYTPAAGYFGADSFTYKANDGTTDSNVATASIVVDAPPVANNQSLGVAENTAGSVTLSVVDPDSTTFTYAVLSGPAHGSLSGTAPNLTYTPTAGYFGADAFTYKANDGTTDSNFATVSITVNAPPAAAAVAVSAVENTSAAVALAASDPDGDSLTYTIVSPPAHGTLSGTAPDLTYTPASGYFGPDSFTYKANDGTIDSNVATASIVVDAPPTAGAVTLSTVENVAAPVALAASDPDGDPLTYAIVTSPAHGSLSGTAPNLTYTPAPGYTGPDSFTYKANDGVTDSNVATVSIGVGVPGTSIVVSASTPELTYGGTVTFTATVAALPPSVAIPTGTVQFLVDGVDVGSLVPLSGGVATLTPSALLAAGAHAVTAVYASADGSFAPGTGTLAGGVTVDQASLTITADSFSRIYGLANPSLTVEYAGFVAGDGPASLTTPVSIATTATAGSHVGVYAITPSGATSSNYAIHYATGTLSVTPAPLTVTAASATKLYGAPLPALTADYSGFMQSDSAASLATPATLTTAATATSGVGTYAITVSGATDPDYTITFAPGTLSVTPAPLTVTAADVSKVYGAPNPAFSAVYSGFVPGENAGVLSGSLTFATVAANSHVGHYGITPGGLSSGNYAITYAQGTLTITPAPLAVVADNQTKAYGAPVPGLTVSFSGFVNGDTAASLSAQPVPTVMATASSDAGSYPITVTGASDPDYTISETPGTLTVTPAPLAITADPATKVYGQPNPLFTVHASGFVLGQDLAVLGGSPAFSTAANASSHVGSYAVTPSGLTSTDYAISYVASSMTITPASLSIVPNGASLRFGGPLPALTASYSGFAAGDTPASLVTPVVLSTAATSQSVPGTYAITASGAADPDYTIHYAAGALTVEPEVPGDYNGDGKSDFAVFYRNPKSSTAVWYVNTTEPAGIRYGSTKLDIPVQGDFNGDGLTDIAVYRASTAQWLIGGQPTIRFGQANVSIPVPADYNGVGHTQIAVYQPNTGLWYVGGDPKPLSLGIKPKAGDIPVPADYDGVGHAEIAIYRPSTQQWFIQGHSQPIRYGGPNDVPVPGDYDGVGHAELALYRPATQQWFVGGHAQPVRFGGPGDVPVPGDYDGVGHTEYVLYRPSTGQWFIGGQPKPIQYGGPHMVPAGAPLAYRSLTGTLHLQGAAVSALDFGATVSALSAQAASRTRAAVAAFPSVARPARPNVADLKRVSASPAHM